MSKQLYFGDDRKIYYHWQNKKAHAKMDGVLCLLSFQEYKNLLLEAGITPYQIGHKGYHLSRYNDAGNYEVGNCRFITHVANMKEQKKSSTQLQAWSINGKRTITACHKKFIR
jgi:hypothetical protein